MRAEVWGTGACRCPLFAVRAPAWSCPAGVGWFSYVLVRGSCARLCTSGLWEGGSVPL